MLLVVAMIFYLFKPGNERCYDAVSDTKPLQSASASRTSKAPSLPVTPLSPAADIEKTKIPEPAPSTTMETKKEDQVLVEKECKDPQKELEYVLNKMFEEEAKEIFPLHTVQTFNPVEPELYGPKEGEVWIRIKVEHSREHKEIMAQVADLYKDVARHDKPVTVMLWVGNRPWAKFQYPSLEENDGASEFIEDEDSSP